MIASSFHVEHDFPFFLWLLGLLFLRLCLRSRDLAIVVCESIHPKFRLSIVGVAGRIRSVLVCLFSLIKPNEALSDVGLFSWMRFFLISALPTIYSFKLFVFLFLADPKVILCNVLGLFFFDVALQGTNQRNAGRNKVLVEVCDANSLFAFHGLFRTKSFESIRLSHRQLLVVELDLLLLDDLHLLLEAREAVLQPFEFLVPLTNNSETGAPHLAAVTFVGLV